MEGIILDNIKDKGCLSLSEFMNTVLYHPVHGYYMSCDPLGESGDFITSPEVSQLFGEVIGVWCMYVWEKMGSPIDFNLIEIGPGRGVLMNDLLRSVKHNQAFCDAVSPILVEISDHLIDIQRNKLSESGFKIVWLQDINNLPNKPTIVIANEFFDALPIDQYIIKNGIAHERVVINNNDQLEFSYLDKAVDIAAPIEKGIIEICPLLPNYINSMVELIKQNKGAALIVDYGYVNPISYSTLQSIKAHKVNNIFNNLGTADITAYVNFGEIINSLMSKMSYMFMTQAEFLLTFGIKERLSTLCNICNNSMKRDNLINGFNYLTDYDKMGKLFKVLLFSRY